MAAATEKQPTKERMVQALYIEYIEPGPIGVRGQPTFIRRMAGRGQMVNVTESQEKRMDAHGSLAPEGATEAQMLEHISHLQDVYRGQRGDVEALGRAMARAAEHSSESSSGDDITNVSLDVEGSSVAELANWLRSEKPTADETVALAQEDPERAAKLIQAENTATGGQPRSTVVQRLEAIAKAG